MRNPAWKKNDPIDDDQRPHHTANDAGQQSGQQGILHKFKLESLNHSISTDLILSQRT